MHLRSTILIGLTLVLVSGLAHAGIPTIVLKSTRAAALNDGRDFHEITAEVRDNSGAFVPDGTNVTFQSTLGQFVGGATTVGTKFGSARIRLISLQKGTANVTASVIGGGFQQTQLVFTDDTAETFQGNIFVMFQGTAVTAYYPGIRFLEASGRTTGEQTSGLPGASLVFRNIQIFADTIQMDCNTNIVKARGHVRIIKGGKRLEASRLFFPLMSGDGFAITAVGRRLTPVHVKGSDLSTDVPPNGVAPQFFEMEDLAQHPQVVLARQIRLFPGDKLQFVRPKFFQEGQQILSMPYYSMALFSSTLIQEQMLSVGSNGLGVDVPLYFDMSPVSMGRFQIRHGEQNGRSAFATRPGWSLDMIQAYNSNGGDHRYAGEFNITGITNSDWGVRWNHSHELNQNTMSSLYLDVPQHRALFGQANLTHQWNNLRFMANISGNRSINGLSASGEEADFSVGTMPKKIAGTPYMMSLNADANMLHTKSLGFTNSVTSQSMNMQLTSMALRLGKQTSLSNYMTFGNVWANEGRGGANVTSNLTLMHSFGPRASMQLAYDYQKQPLTLLGTGNHKISTMLRISGGSKWDLFLFGSSMLDALNSTLVSDFNYSIAPRWHVNFSSTLQQFTTASYRDFSLGIARTVGGRDVVLSYSTFNHRFYFDLQANRF